jgi:hypothetical protein
MSQNKSRETASTGPSGTKSLAGMGKLRPSAGATESSGTAANSTGSGSGSTTGDGGNSGGKSGG